MSAARLQRLIASVDDPDLAAWLSAGLRRWEAGESLDRALELSGGRAMAVRDAALREAAELLDPRQEQSRWQRAGMLKRRIASFERIFPRFRDRPDAFQEGVNAALATAFRSGCCIPKSQRGLWDVLKNSPESFNSAA